MPPNTPRLTSVPKTGSVGSPPSTLTAITAATKCKANRDLA